MLEEENTQEEQQNAADEVVEETADNEGEQDNLEESKGDPSEQLQQWKQASRHHEREKKQARLELKTAQEKLEELEASSKSKITQLEEAAERANAAEARAARLEASLKYNLPIELVEKLTGKTPEELEESAKIVAEYAGKNPSNRLIINTQGSTSEKRTASTLEERISAALKSKDS